MSTLHIYFKPEIETNEGFKTTKTSGKNSYNKTHFCGMQVFRKGAEWYTSDLEIGHKIPEVASPFVSWFSYHECFPLNPNRETGVYLQEGTEAELNVNSSNYFVQLRGAGREQIQKLLRAIRAGTVRPTESFEGPQTGCSKAELEQMLAQSEAMREDLALRLNNALGDLARTTAIQ